MRILLNARANDHGGIERHLRSSLPDVDLIDPPLKADGVADLLLVVHNEPDPPASLPSDLPDRVSRACVVVAPSPSAAALAGLLSRKYAVPVLATLPGDPESLVGMIRQVQSAQDDPGGDEGSRDPIERETTARALLNAPMEFAVLFDRGLRLVDLSDRALRLFRQGREQLIGRTPEQLLPDTLAKRRRERAQRVMTTGRPDRFKAMTMGRWFDIRLFPVRGEGGEITGLALYATDLSDTHRVERSLRRSEERYRQLFNAIGDVVIIYGYDDEGRPGPILEVNQAACDLFGLDRDQIVGRPALEMVPEDQHGRVLQFSGRIRRGERVTFEGSARRGDGSTLPVVFTIHRFQLDDHEAALAVLHDLEGLQEKEAIRRQEEQRFRTLVEHSSDMLAVTDELGTLKFVSPSVQAVLGYSPGEVTGTSAFSYLHPDDVEFMHDRMRGVLSNVERVPLGVEVRMMHRDGHFVHLELKGVDRRHIPGIEGVVVNARDISDRVEHERRLKESRAKYRELYNNALIGLYRTAIDDGRVLAANDRMAQLFGYPDSDTFIAQGKMSDHYAEPDGRARFIARLKQHGETLNLEERLVRLNGEVFWLRYSAKLYPERGYLEGVALDITEEKSAQQAFHESEERFRLVVEQSNDAIYLIGSDGQFVFVNPRFEALFGVDGKAVVQRDFSFMQLVAPQSQAEIKLRREALRRGEELDSRYDFVGRRLDGTTFDAEASVSHVVIGEESMTLGIIRDITERKEAERARAWMIQSLEAAPVAVVLTDAAGYVRWVNRFFRTHMEYSLDEMQGRHSFEIFDPTSSSEIKIDRGPRVALRQFLRGFSGSVRVLSKSGDMIPVYVEISPVFDDRGRRLGFVNVAMDERKLISLEREKDLMENELNRQFHLSQVGLLASGFAHNLKTPLSAITMLAQNTLLRMSKGEGEGRQGVSLEAVRETLDSVARQAGDMGQIIDEMMQYHRMNANVRSTIVDVNHVLRSDAAILTADLDLKHNVSLALELGEGPIFVRAKASDIGQIFLNLAANARDAVLRSEVKQITVRSGTGPEAGVAWFEVRDTGPGFSRHVLREWGKPFLTTKAEDPDYRRRGSGTGLGLYMIKRLLKGLDGDMEIDSEPGDTRIRIRLPLASREEIARNSRRQLTSLQTRN